MQSELMMFIGLCTLIGVAMGYYALFRIKSEIAMAYSALTLIAVLHVCGYTCGLLVGSWVFSGLAAAGLILFLVRGRERAGFFSFGVAALAALFGVMLIAFHGDYIQTYDDFHQWAAEVKYMLQHHMIPTGADFVGQADVPPESSLFVAFYQILGGYNEGHMYTASFLLTAVAAVIPLMRIRWREWYKGVLYLVLVYAGFFSLYNQPYKSIYVDLPAAVWAGAVCVLWTMLGDAADRTGGGSGSDTGKTGDRRRFLMILPFLIFLPRIKWGVSFLLWAFTLGYILVDLIARMPSGQFGAFWKRRWKYIVGVIAAVFALIAGAWFVIRSALIPASLSGIAEALTISSKKARLTLSTLLHNIFQKSLTGNPNMPFRTVQATILIVILLLVLATWCRRCVRKRTLIAQAVYFPVCVVLYVIALYVCYVSVFSYEEAVRNSTGYRYLSIVIVFGFIILCGHLLISMAEEEKPECLDAGKGSDTGELAPDSVQQIPASAQRSAGLGRRVSPSIVTSILLCLLLISNFNTKLIYKASSLQPWRNKNYRIIKETKEQIGEIREVITDEDRVYMLSNEYSLKEMNEYPLCVALYYLDHQVSNYLREPWKFTKDGSISFLHETDVPVEQFPAMLQAGGYTYVWVHSYDEYLSEKFEELFGCTLETAGLYEVVQREDGSMTLELRKAMESTNPHEEKEKEAEEADI